MKYFIGNTWAQNYTETVEHFLISYKILGCAMCTKLHFLDSRIANLPKNLGVVNDESNEQFYQYLKVMEAHQGRWNVNMRLSTDQG